MALYRELCLRGPRCGLGGWAANRSPLRQQWSRDRYGLAGLSQKPVDAILVGPNPFAYKRRAQLVTLAAYHRVPAIYPLRDFAEVGGLMSYGTSITEANRLAGVYVGRVLKGAKPADLPVMQSTKFEFVINLNTAKAFGLSLPPGLLAIADEVIE